MGVKGNVVAQQLVSALAEENPTTWMLVKYNDFENKDETDEDVFRGFDPLGEIWTRAANLGRGSVGSGDRAGFKLEILAPPKAHPEKIGRTARWTCAPGALCEFFSQNTWPHGKERPQLHQTPTPATCCIRVSLRLLHDKKVSHFGGQDSFCGCLKQDYEGCSAGYQCCVERPCSEVDNE